jgi:SAM-dependent methyltransferase
MSPTTFDYHGVTLAYERGAYNWSALNERAVEIPAARSFVVSQATRLWGQEGRGLEVGAVLPHYGIHHGVHMPGHVVDLYEEGEGINSLDVFDIRASYDYIVSISTLEHVRWDDPAHDRDPEGGPAALRHLLSLLRPGGQAFVTIPLGHHHRWDDLIASGELEPTRDVVYARQGGDPVQWAPMDRGWWAPYGASSMWAEGVWIAEWHA